MAQNPYVNKVIYGNQTLIDTTGDTAVASDVASGKTFHSATGEQLTGTKPAPTSITPSNATYVGLQSGNEYAPTESGVAIKTYSSVNPTETNAYGPFDENDIVKFNNEGYVIGGRYELSFPSSDPVHMDSHKHYYTNSYNGVDVIKASYVSDITPSRSNPASMASGSIYRPSTGGFAIDTYTELTPSNSTPATLSTTSMYKPLSSGYAISSYSSVTPSTSGQYFSSGMVKMSSSGYAYSSRPSGASNYTELTRQSTAASSHTFSVTNGKVYLALVAAWGPSSLATTRYDGATCSGGTITKLCNLTDSTSNATGTFYVVKATSSSITISHTYSNHIRVFSAT